MGGTQSQNAQSSQDLLADFTEVRRQPNGLVLADKKNENTYFLKEFNFVNKKEYQQQFKRLQGVESQPQNQNVLPLVRLFSQTFNNICSNSYKIYALYEYPSITLEEEISARKKEEKYFDECELWSILQSCANALGQLKPTLSLHPKNVFIVPDGVLKIINNQMVDEDYRCYIKDGLYYAPEKIRDFKKNDNENSLRKQSIFSLGMTLLHAALLRPVNDCYNYQSFEFQQAMLERNLEELVNSKNLEEQEYQTTQRGRYSEEFIEMLAMILEPNPNKRASLMEVHGMLTKVWNTETDEENVKNGQGEDQIENQLNESQQQIESGGATLKASKQLEEKSVSSEFIYRGQNEKSNKNIRNTETKRPSEAEVMAKGQTSQSKSYLPSFHQSERQSKPSLNEVNNPTKKMVPKLSESSSTFPVGGYIPSSSFMYTPPGLGPLPAPSSNKQNGLYTDPKLLEMIRKDLQDLNQLKKSSMMNSYGVGYSNPYLGSSYYSGYGDIGSGILSSKTHLGLSNTNVQQIYTVNTEANYLSQRNQNLTLPNLKAQIPKQLPLQNPTQKEQQGFSKPITNQVYVVEEYEDGRKFEGTLVNGAKEGHGKLTYSDGAYYEGDFRKDKMEGKGTLFYGLDRPAYDGNWVADQFHGYGVLYNENPLELNGTFNYNDFNLIEDFWVRYEGHFDSDNKSGQGKLILSNGEEFYGNFENDCINGKGVFITKEGVQITGVWQENVLVQIDAQVFSEH